MAKQVDKYLKLILENTLKMFSSKIARCVMALLMAIMLLALTWIADGLPYSSGGEAMTMKMVHITSLLSKTRSSKPSEKFLAINMSYDQELVPVEDEYGMPLGEIVISDRKKLSRFLDLLKDTPYSAIGIDIFFDSNLQTESDSILFSQINNMDRLAVATHSEQRPNKRINKNKLALSDYNINIYDNSFSKYCFISPQDEESLALSVYHLSTNNKIDFNSINHHRNLYLYLRYPMNSRYSQSRENNWYNLGCDILDVYDKEMLRKMVDGKVILIGDYEGYDMHDSYIGQISGPGILLNSIEALFCQDYKVKISSMISLFILFITICLFMSYGISYDLFGFKFSLITRMLLDFIGFAVILTIFEIVLGMWNHEFHDMMLTSFFLTIYSAFCRKLNLKYPIAFTSNTTK